MSKGKFAIIGRELMRSKQIRDQLSATFHSLEVRCIPFITTIEVPFELPTPRKTPLYLFTSPRNVEIFFKKATLPKEALIASIGFATTKALCDIGHEPHFTSPIENARGMAPELLQYITVQTQQFHIIQPSSNIAGHYLYDFFKEKGFEYTRLVTYEVQSNPELKRQLSLLETPPEWVLFYSPSGVRAWSEVSSSRPLAFSIGPVTTKELEKEGWSEIHESDSPHEIDIIRTITKNYII